MNLAPVQLSSETRALAAVNRWMGTLSKHRRQFMPPVLPGLVAEVQAAIEGRDLIRMPEKPVVRKAVAR